MNLKKLTKTSDAVMTTKEQERMLIEEGVITKNKLNELINKFKSKCANIPVNIVNSDTNYNNDIEWNRISVSVEIGKYLLKLDYLYAGYIDTDTNDISLDIDDGGAWIYENKNYNWEPTNFEDAAYAFMGGQEEEFIDAVRADFDEYVRNNYKKYFKKH